MMRNRLANARNPFQGDRKKVLCVCSAGLLRSPTAAWILSNEPFGFNTRACGAEPEYALVPLDEALVFWADEIVVMEDWQRERIVKVMDSAIFKDKPIHVLDAPDQFEFRDPRLVEFMTDQFKNIYNKE